jgi:hypothetical protein
VGTNPSAVLGPRPRRGQRLLPVPFPSGLASGDKSQGVPRRIAHDPDDGGRSPRKPPQPTLQKGGQSPPRGVSYPHESLKRLLAYFLCAEVVVSGSAALGFVNCSVKPTRRSHLSLLRISWLCPLPCSNRHSLDAAATAWHAQDMAPMHGVHPDRPPTRVLAVAISICAGLLSSETAAQQSGYWLEIENSGGNYSRHAVAYDAALQRGVLFGGLINSFGPTPPVNGSTMVWTGAVWSAVSTLAAPSARFEHALSYDSGRSVTVLFGGQDWGGAPADTWEYGGSGWSLVPTPLPAPSARIGHAMCFDVARARTVLFGGFGGPAVGLLSDTWEWNGAAWSRINLPGPLPPPRRDHAMCYDVGRGRVVLYGGRDWNGVSGGTWEYDGTGWTEVLTAASPVAAVDCALTYHAGWSRVVLFGGESIQGLISNQTWTFDGQGWVQLQAGGNPAAVSSVAAFYDPIANKVVATGGYSVAVAAATRVWCLSSSSSGTGIAFGIGCGSQPLTLTVSQRPVLGQVARADISNAPTTIFGHSLGWSNQLPWPLVLPIELLSAGMPGCYLWQSNDVLSFSVDPAVQFAIPVSYGLVGSHLFSQAFAFAPGQNPAQVVSSNAIDWRLGDI